MYHRRIRDRNCFIGEQLPQPAKIVKYCACSEDDFEWYVLFSLFLSSSLVRSRADVPERPPARSEYNYKRDSRGKCVLVEGAEPLEAEKTCPVNEPFWYDRTNMRKIPHSKCEGGLQLDKGSRHVCPGHAARSGFFWATIAVLPFGIAALAAIWWTRRRTGGGGKGRIRLSEPGESTRSSAVVDLLASVPYFVVGMAGALLEKVRELPWIRDRLRQNRRGGYRNLRLDLDAELLDNYSDEDL